MPDHPTLQGTRGKLIAAALRLFGSQGFDATSVRQIATEADANLAAVGYHFGGKDGLRLACAEWIVDRVQSVFDQTGGPIPDTPKAATAVLEHVIGAMAEFIIRAPEAEMAVAFILRELDRPGAVFDRFYETLFIPRHRMLCALWATATGADPDSEETRLAVFAMLGQVVYFRIGRPIVLRRMDWPEIGDEQAARLRATLLTNLRASLAAHHRRS